MARRRRSRRRTHYRLTPKRRASIIKAQRISARKRKKSVRGKDTVGYWAAKGVKKTASVATMGMSSKMFAGKHNHRGYYW